MTPERWKLIRTALEDLLKLEGASRAALLETYAKDPELHQELTSLIAAEEQSDDFLERPATASPPRTQVGPYQLVRELGHGGMGTVYEAHREGEFSKRVALKVVRRGMDTEAIIGRFRTERQILAGLEHPNIVPLLDGGTTEDGLPYFVMAYVEGTPIDRFCRDHSLDVNAKLRLFLQVCDAVDTAHRNLVVHRDLKPGNILVDQQGQVRLLDFGIARLVSREGQASATTSAGLRMLTPEYASPEQVQGLRVSTASDVFSLGVLLFELLTGRRPWTPVDESTGALLAAVAEQPAPSLRSSDRALSVDLDLIVQQALRKQPDRRTASVERLADDLRRLLDGRPVSARGESFTYLARTFIRRHRLGFSAASAVALSLVGGIVATTHQAQVARAQRLRAEAARSSAEGLVDFMLGDLRKRLEPSNRLEVMGDIAAHAQAYFDGLGPEDRSNDSEVRRASVSTQLAQLKVLEGKIDEADQLNEAAMTVLTRLGPDAGSEEKLADAFGMRGRIAEERGTPQLAATAFHESRLRWERIAQQHPTNENLAWLASLWNDEGRMAWTAGQRDEAKSAHTAALVILERLPDTDRSVGLQRSITGLYLARIAEDSSDYAEATLQYRASRDLALHLMEANPADAELAHHAAVVSDDLSRVQRLAGHLEDSERDGALALTMLKTLNERDPDNGLWKSDLSSAYSFLGRTHELQGKLSQALREFSGDADLMRDLVKREPSNAVYLAGLGDALTNVGRAHRRSGAVALALLATQEGLAVREGLTKTAPDDPWAAADLGDSYLELGRDRLAAKDSAGARAAWQQARTILEPVMKVSQLARHRSKYAQVLLELGELDLARPVVKALLAEHYNEPLFLETLLRSGLGSDTR